ncbi:MAG: hypothetical protein NPIRA04_31390 [Nitrospirales bacterium]|nr:MAG: hypothetical protein NPIRA04_31390 [Nitrospirales bacterium]
MVTTKWEELANRTKQVLGLSHAPIAITFSQEAPEDVPFHDGAMPDPSADGRTGKVTAGCVFWIQSEERTFTTKAEDHFNCSVGSVTHGLKALGDVMQNEDVQGLLESEWVTPEEAMQLPVVKKQYRFITYGPVSQTSIDPDVVFLRLNASQGMVLHDAFSDMSIVGKPQCHIIPLAKEQNQIAMSTGCTLSRIRTGMSPDEMTCAIPGSRMAEVVDKLEARREANARVASYANADGRRFPKRQSLGHETK